MKLYRVRLPGSPPTSQTDTESGDSVRITSAAVNRCIGRGDLRSRSAKVRGTPLIDAYHAADEVRFIDIHHLKRKIYRGLGTGSHHLWRYDGELKEKFSFMCGLCRTHMDQ